ncbi:uncharacterized protein LOC126091983 [Schistocerca cancellata]|uniref:uncharacterized protein LOC126091983 n=1 Tax=Schistocerca cancellata TaxID=274614 RepID=UPI00211799D2|nr:uncharacterized protein LOC126091983 [Schistocerca cancellata]
MLLEILLIFGLSIWNGSHAHLEHPELCVVSSLETPYFTPWLETPRKARGCWATPHASSVAEVHVLVLRGPRVSPWVSLDVLGSGLRNSLVLVLTSAHAVNWKITTRLPNGVTVPHVMVSNGSTLESHTELNTSQHWWRNRRALQRYLHHQFKDLASYTEVQGANRIELTVGLSWPEEYCDMQSLSESRVVSASRAVQIRTEGCFHKNYIGDNPMDVYVVEMDAGPRNNGRDERADRASLPVVLVHLHEGGDSGDTLLTELHNLTLVLKSSQPVRWRFGHTPRNTGKIVIVSNEGDQVENEDHPGLSVRWERLPDRLDTLLLAITKEFGVPPVLYARTGRASTLNLIVGTCTSNGCAGDSMKVIPVAETSDVFHLDGWKVTEDTLGVMQQQPVSSDRSTAHNLKTDEIREEILARLKKAMIVNCSEKRFTITFPLSVVKQLGSPQLSFSDRSCIGVPNSTHVTLTSPLTSCGSTSAIDRGLTAFYNYIQVQPAGIEETSEDKEFYGDLAESEGIPIVCKNQPYYIGGKVDVSDSSTFDMVEHNGVRHKSLYNMDLFRDKELNQQLHFDPLNVQIEEVRYGEQIFVRAWMEGGGTKVQLVTENCWLTNSSDPKSKIQKFLLRNACPVDSSVSLLQQHGSFSFKTSPEYVEVGVVYMHCRIGMCTYLESLTKGNLALCVNRTQHCSKPRSQPLVNQTTVSTAQQIVTRGPLKFVPNFLTHVKSIAAIPSPTSAEAVFPHVVDMSTTCVSIQATVGIALTSFVIGIVLMIIIWFIHVKTDPLRHHRTKQVHQTGGITTGNISAGGTVFNVPPNSVGSSANL